MRRTAALATAGVVVLLLVVGQLVLPSIAAHILRNRLAKSGTVLSVSVSAFPAIELLWHDADHVVVRMANYNSSTSHLTSLLDEAGGVGSLDASAGVLHAGLLTVHDAVLRKRGNRLTGNAVVTDSDLHSAVSFLQSVKPISSSDGQLTLQGTANVPFLGSITGEAIVAADSGQLVLAPQGLASVLGRFTIFSNPHIVVDSVGGSATPGGMSVSATGTFR